MTVTAVDGSLTARTECDGSTTYSLEAATFTFTRSGDASDELFVDTATLGTIQNILNAAEGVVIPAGAISASYQPDTGEETGMVTIEISNGAFPGTFIVGDPADAEALVSLDRSTVVDCPARPRAEPPSRAEPLPGTPTLTG